MIEEPYRWVEAIANRREYIEAQLASGSPIAALGYRDGILFLTLGRARQKIFEIYDRIAMGAIGHPGDIERLRMAAIELASTEGFTRSAADVSLRRLVHYSLSPVMKSAFEQVYGPPYLARMPLPKSECARNKTVFVGRIRWRNRNERRNLRASAAGFRRLSGTRQSRRRGVVSRAEHAPDASFEAALKAALMHGLSGI
jgi:hypothetical protein